MTLAPRARTLKYHRIADEMRRRLTAMPVGARLPSERELAEQFDCNVLTVRKGLASLVDEGRIERRLGSGTFVLDGGAEAEAESPAVETGLPPVRSTVETPAAATRIGVLAFANTDRYGQQVVQALGRVSMARDIDLQMTWVPGMDDAAVNLQVAQLQSAGCSALVLPWFPHSEMHAVASFVRRCPLPVSLPMLIPGMERNCFEHPDFFGRSTLTITATLVRYFKHLGYTRIALLGPASPADPILQAKLSAYACAAAELRLENLTGLIGPTSADVDALAERWRSEDGDLAVISYDDTHALRFVTAMHKLGLSAPTDFAIMGHNNTEASAYCDPPLSSICQDFDYVGSWLLKNAQALAAGQTAQSKAPPPYRLVVRETCGAAQRLDEEFLCDMTSRGLSIKLDESLNLADTH